MILTRVLCLSNIPVLESHADPAFIRRAAVSTAEQWEQKPDIQCALLASREPVIKFFTVYFSRDEPSHKCLWHLRALSV